MSEYEGKYDRRLLAENERLRGLLDDINVIFTCDGAAIFIENMLVTLQYEEVKMILELLDQRKDDTQCPNT